ncbi:uncharacterized protein LAJ45_00402 [Morchella importuna]|uniref:uncharacterized protein n=1 Tax=Morchella importuna TaxID=1174673 RepID=UPI001E8E2234|nr:uncharacterized protein LAJ45_00402 [Morchella importuna]KAH8155392.1 hypothetical protein LAJ45_00402 [Morchella importuna]
MYLVRYNPKSARNYPRQGRPYFELNLEVMRIYGSVNPGPNVIAAGQLAKRPTSSNTSLGLETTTTNSNVERRKIVVPFLLGLTLYPASDLRYANPDQQAAEVSRCWTSNLIHILLS